VLPAIFRAVVTCRACKETIAAGAPIVHPLSKVQGMLEAGFLLGAGVDVTGRQDVHSERCRNSLYVFGIEEVHRDALPHLAPWLGLRR
jgi:hypothetical protein